jgi:hypothetical protein
LTVLRILAMAHHAYVGITQLPDNTESVNTSHLGLLGFAVGVSTVLHKHKSTNPSVLDTVSEVLLPTPTLPPPTYAAGSLTPSVGGGGGGGGEVSAEDSDCPGMARVWLQVCVCGACVCACPREGMCRDVCRVRMPCAYACVRAPVCVRLCAYAGVRMPVCVCLCAYACVRMPVCVCFCAYARVRVPVCACLCAYACVRMHVCVCLCACACVRMPMCVCLCACACACVRAETYTPAANV